MLRAELGRGLTIILMSLSVSRHIPLAFSGPHSADLHVVALHAGDASDSTAGSPAPRATKPSEGVPTSANTTASEPTPVEEAANSNPKVSSDARKAEDFVNSSDSQDPKSSTSATPPARTPPERSSPPEDSPDPVDYEESKSDQDREQGEVLDPSPSPQLTEQQRVTHPGSPMTPKTAAAVARVDAQTRCESP
ncbi:unnamed protein product [Phytophthora fragariaefolia]|uniref:Unnamed protein product n=1 Tax=Phytophthora fragariaefolia TaxID=1490495 RepID=A0A9W6XQF6_9STRA|nr:unnamed protein product [Phytophthora fragariaefolia]